MPGEAEAWFVSVAGQQLGPMTRAKLQWLVDSGRLRPEHLVWRAGFRGWVAAGRALPSMFQQEPAAERRRPSQRRSSGIRSIPGLAAISSVIRGLVQGLLTIAAVAALVAGLSRIEWNAVLRAISKVKKDIDGWVDRRATESRAMARERQIQEALFMPNNAPLRAFLEQDHQLQMPPPRPQRHQHSWQDDRGQRIREGCGFSEYRDPDIPVVQLRVSAPIDLGAAQALEAHFGHPKPLPLQWTRSDLPEGNTEVARRRTEALSLHGVRESARAISVDHAWIIRQSVPLLRDFAREVARRFPRIENQGDRPRDVVAMVSVVQAIPYRLVPEHQSWENFGLRTPVQTLLQGGDCDSKSLLLATLLRAIRPDLPIVLIRHQERGPDSSATEPHMLVGIGIPARPCDTTIIQDGRAYVVVETTSMWQIGNPSEDFNPDKVDRLTQVP